MIEDTSLFPKTYISYCSGQHRQYWTLRRTWWVNEHTWQIGVSWCWDKHQCDEWLLESLRSSRIEICLRNKFTAFTGDLGLQGRIMFLVRRHPMITTFFRFLYSWILLLQRRRLYSALHPLPFPRRPSSVRPLQHLQHPSDWEEWPPLQPLYTEEVRYWCLCLTLRNHDSIAETRGLVHKMYSWNMKPKFWEFVCFLTILGLIAIDYWSLRYEAIAKHDITIFRDEIVIMHCRYRGNGRRIGSGRKRCEARATGEERGRNKRGGGIGMG